MSARLSRSLVGGVAAIALGGGGLTVLAPASAETGSVNYACTGPETGDFVGAVEIDSSPDPVAAGAALTFVTTLTIPAELRPPDGTADNVRGTIDLDVTGAGGSQTVAQLASDSPIPPTGAYPVVATGTWTPTASGDYTLNAGEIRAVLRAYLGDTPAYDPATITCTAPGVAPTIDTLSVTATSTTRVELNSTRVKFGQDVQAKAEVATTGGAAKGNVVFTLGDRSETVAVAANGEAQTTLRSDVAPGSKYPVTATFVPTDAKNVAESTATRDLKVVKDKSNVQVRVGDTRRGRKVKARISINAVHGEKVTGKVKVILKDGSKNLRVKTKRLRDEDRKVGLIRLYEPGKYKVRVKYLGSSEIRKSSDKTTFRVEK